jgi:TolB-like protein
MKALFAFAFSFGICLALVAQPTRIAIIDFENISGIAKYDGLGKAMSSMLISDIEANVSPKRLQLVERAQIQKVIKEQNFQASASVDKTTIVQAGKILGVAYMLVGDVYVLNEQLIINARLTNTETGDIVFSKKQEGKSTEWLTLKTAIAKDIATNLSMPFTEPTIEDTELAIGTITTFGNAIVAKDEGNIEKAQSLADAVSEINPEFTYIEDLRVELDKLKLQVAKNTEDIRNLNDEVTENVTDYFELGNKYAKENNFKMAEKYFKIGLEKLSKNEISDKLDFLLALCEIYYNNKNYDLAYRYAEKGLNIWPYFKEFIYFKYKSLVNLDKIIEFDAIVDVAIAYSNLNSDSLTIMLQKSLKENGLDENLIIAELVNISERNKEERGLKFGSELYFDNRFEYSLNELVIGCLQEVYEDTPEKLCLLLRKLDLSKSTIETRQSVNWYTMVSGDIAYSLKEYSKSAFNSFWRISDCAELNQLLPNAKNSIMLSNSLTYIGDNKLLRFTESAIDTILITAPVWHYKYEDGRSFITTNPIEAYVFGVNPEPPIIELIYCLNESNCVTWGSISDENKMILVNLAHAYLLSGNEKLALEIYKLFPDEYQFNQRYNNLKFKKVLSSDWDEFIKQGLLTKEQANIISHKLFE